MADVSGAVDLGAPKGEEEQEKPSEEGTNQGPKQVLFSFAVIMTMEGNPEVIKFQHPSIDPLLEPTDDLLFMAVKTIAKDLQAAETATAAAHMTAGILQQQAQAMMEQQQNAQIAAQLQAHPMAMKR